MNEQNATIVDVEPNLRHQGSEERLAVGGRLGLRPFQRLLAELSIALFLVGASTLGAVETDAIVVVAHDRWNVLASNPIDHLIRERRVANEIAEAIDPIGPFAADIVQDRIQRRDVAVNVADQGDTHSLGLTRPSRGK